MDLSGYDVADHALTPLPSQSLKFWCWYRKKAYPAEPPVSDGEKRLPPNGTSRSGPAFALC
jgi:hypothetical protein